MIDVIRLVNRHIRILIAYYHYYYVKEKFSPSLCHIILMLIYKFIKARNYKNISIKKNHLH
ncbi:uncharacterized protein BX663DRAFT_506452 [Cokeromyces recurvatus]|uniref:uncharacterized protein n=1 Tax=Cokeromyces recurvatus TaxID=90255 RepID=UPI0022201887|nr:uncharacterized protein BX663DRAFT_506452 [Cokeromyces recurvatus]KAI7904109.1 hypothetical protein BX663DRAFT_506452 [Cokeromyces recurvatus]